MSAARVPCQKVLDYGCLVCTISALTRPVESAFSAAALSGFGCAFASCSGCETSTLTFSGVWGEDALIWSNNHWLSNWAEAPMDVNAATATTTEGKNLDFMMSVLSDWTRVDNAHSKAQATFRDGCGPVESRHLEFPTEVGGGLCCGTASAVTVPLAVGKRLDGLLKNF